MRAPLCAAIGVVLSVTLLASPYAGAAPSRPNLESPAESTVATETAPSTRLSEARVSAILRTDETAHLTDDGRLYYVDPVRPGRKQPTRSAKMATGTAAAALTADPVALQSRPGSRRTIFLDFDGATLTNSPWNVPDDFYVGYDSDGDSTTFDDAENAFIADVWRRVSEAFSPYDVNVSTQDLGSNFYTRTSYTDAYYGVHVLANGGDASGICGGCAGVAFVGTFPAAPTVGDEIVWTFPSFSSKENAETTVHEVGHTLGLEHDGLIDADEYYAGHGDWAPFMGSGNNVIQQFSKGDYADANNKQDDLQVMTTYGLPRVPDDHLGTIAASSSLGARTSYAVDGIIGTRTDLDVFEVVHPCTDPLTATATGIGDGSTLDLKVEILSPGGTVLDTDNPDSGNDGNFPAAQAGMEASATTAAPSGTYYVRVDGVGFGSALTDGYADYASIGQYHLEVSGCPAATGTAPNAPTGLGVTSSQDTGTFSWTAAAGGSSPVTGYRVSGVPNGPVEVPASTTSLPLTGLVGGSTLLVSVTALNASGSSTTARFTKDIARWAPTAPPSVTVTPSGSTAYVKWSPVAYLGGAVYTAWKVVAASSSFTFTFNTFGEDRLVALTGLPNGSYTLTVTPTSVPAGAPKRTTSFTIGPKKPGAPKIGTAASGTSGGTISALARWAAPTSNGGSAITGYRVRAYKYSAGGSLLASYTSSLRSASSRSYAMTLTSGRYRFKVYAYNKIGGSPASAASNLVIAR